MSAGYDLNGDGVVSADEFNRVRESEQKLKAELQEAHMKHAAELEARYEAACSAMSANHDEADIESRRKDVPEADDARLCEELWLKNGETCCPVVVAVEQGSNQSSMLGRVPSMSPDDMVHLERALQRAQRELRSATNGRKEVVIKAEIKDIQSKMSSFKGNNSEVSSATADELLEAKRALLTAEWGEVADVAYHKVEEEKAKVLIAKEEKADASAVRAIVEKEEAEAAAAFVDISIELTLANLASKTPNTKEAAETDPEKDLNLTLIRNVTLTLIWNVTLKPKPNSALLF